MDAELYKLIRLMADGRFYSGEKLASSFGITRAAIWKRMQRIDGALQLGIDRVPGRGYRLARPLILLDKHQIVSAMASPQSSALDTLHLLPTVDSTNDFIARSTVSGTGHCIACLAEQQTAGRGRRGRSWVSVFGENIYLSLGYSFSLPLTQLSGLSIAAGVSLAQVLGRHGLQQHTLKWPNDIHSSGRKLAGILVDASGDMEGPSRAVIGLGLNLRLHRNAAAGIDQPWTDLSSEMAELPDRNQLAGDILSSLIQACQVYESKGLQPFLQLWQKFDKYQGRKIDLHQGRKIIKGRYIGLADDGGLILETSVGRQVYYAGEVSMRTAE
jgi:BirA family biotin operon repressor/biotin-[acetyl-CoA-carboxylase] ligase